ncbi:MAG: 4-hydroxy-3-methylbut-2-enyl diphosphate reductase [Chloroflexi bacterium]|nr:4-hydroxy-3-methylbut-2-enyl diphosphate reductase [Chloroflexota bacterium]
MQVIRASRYGGFCGGVKRAWKLALQEVASTDGPVYLSGKLIHNGPAMRELEGMAIRVVSLADGEDPVGGTLIVRAHGEGPRLYELARQHQLRTVDATCSIVKAVQRRARALEQQGYQVILFGHKTHPEALATVAYTEHGQIVESVAEAEALGHFAKIAAIAQTTAPQWEYEAVCRVLRRKCDEFEDQGRICGWTLSAQEEAAHIAQQVQAMVVIGGRDSSNTHRLVEVCSRHCPSYHVETADELDPRWFAGLSVVGVTAGASTRDRDIEDLVARLEAIETAPRRDERSPQRHEDHQDAKGTKVETERETA